MTDSRRVSALVAAGIVVIGVTVGSLLMLAGPPAVRAAARGQGISVLNSRLKDADQAKIDKYIHRFVKLGWTAIALALVSAAALYFFTRQWYFDRFVKEATPGTLGAIRMLAAGVLLWNTLWEHLPSLAYLPPEMRIPMGFMQMFYRLPIHFDAFLASPGALAVFQTITAAFLLASAVGWRTRAVVPIAAFCWFIQGGIIRQYAWFTHQGIVSFYVLTAMSFFPCGDGFSLDRLIRIARGKPVVLRDRTAAVYGWGRYACWVIFGMCYLDAGLSKIRNGGWMWWHPDNLRGVVLHDALSPMHFNWPFGLMLQNAPDWIFALLGLGAQFGEVLGVLVLFSYVWRHIYAAFIVTLHLGIWLLQNVLFFDLIFMQLMLIDFRTLRKRIGAALNRRRGRAQVLYDGWCPLCRRTLRVISSLDLLERIDWTDFRRAGAIDQFNLTHRASITPEQAEKEMVLVHRGGDYRGFDAYRAMSMLVPALWPIAPLMVLPGVSSTGRAIYAKVAASRLNPLNCDENCPIETMEPPPLQPRPAHGLLYPLAVGALAAGLLAVWAVSFEYYPFTGVQMYSGRHRGADIIYIKVLAHYESGAVERAHLEKAVRGLADTRYRRGVEMCFDPIKQKTAEKFLLTCTDLLNRKAAPGSRVTALEVQRWKWNFRTQAADPAHGQMTSRFIATPGEKTPLFEGAQEASFIQSPAAQ